MSYTSNYTGAEIDNLLAKVGAALEDDDDTLKVFAKAKANFTSISAMELSRSEMSALVFRPYYYAGITDIGDCGIALPLVMDGGSDSSAWLVWICMCVSNGCLYLMRSINGGGWGVMKFTGSST